MRKFSLLCLTALAFVVFLSPDQSFAANYGFVGFEQSDIYIYESQGTVPVGVVGTGGALSAGASIAATLSNGTPPTSAVKSTDYSATASFSLTGGYGNGLGTVGNLDGGATLYFNIGLVDNSVTNVEKTIGLVIYSSLRTQTNITACTVHILDDDFTVGISVLESKAYEAGQVPGKLLVTRTGDVTHGVTVNFARSGTATINSDYTLVANGSTITDSVNIPDGSNSVLIAVVPVSDATIEPTKTMILDLAAGTYIMDTLQTGGTVTIIDNCPVVSIVATDANASESGDSGLFTVTRTADTGAPLLVKYNITGTASNGVDYAYLSNSVTILAGETFATITVAPIFDLIAEGSETVTLTLVTNGYFLSAASNATVTIADFDDNSRTSPVIGGGVDPNSRYGRFSRGSGTDPTYQSFLIPLDFQQGISLSNSTGNAATLFPGIAWTSTNYHYNATNSVSPIPFLNPIAAFGNRVGGSPLYFGQPYRFGIYAGDPRPNYTNTSTYTNALHIKVYDQSTFSLVATTNFLIPNISSTNEWRTFLTNGYTKTLTSYGLTTTLSFNNSGITWDVLTGTSNYFDVAYHITHTATNGGTKYIYLMEMAGGTDQGWLVKDSSTNRAWSPLYTIEFEDRPAWRSMLLKTPQFFHTPMPPGYIGRSTEELLTNNPAVTAVVSVPNSPSTYTNLDQSPELRQSPVLDQLVTELGGDPILLANYVLNEIELTDAIDYNDNGAFSETSVNLGGVKRGALGTFLEGQGSPTEQCALLVYLLRKAGYPAIYQFAPHNGLKLVDARLSKLLRTQIRGAVDNDGNAYTTNQFIPVNYPWVAVYIGTNWVHVFPWLKDTEVETGFDLYSFMPPQYDNAFKWARAYSYGDTNLLALSPEDDSPLLIYPRFIEKTLRENAPGVSVDDVGMKAWNRRHYFTRWGDFPTPTSLTNVSIAVESLGDSSITNVSPVLTNIFDTVSVEIKSAADSSKKVASGTLRLAEIHNRRLVAWHTKVATNQHTLTLSLVSFRTNITATKAFSSVQLTNNSNTNILVNLTTNVSLAAADDVLTMTLVNNRHRSVPGSYYGSNYWTPYLGFAAPLSITNTRSLRKGDLTAICIDVGRVTRKMLDQHATQIWQMEKAGTAGSTDAYQGSIAYLMGMSYFEKVSRFADYATPLHKAQPIAFFGSGLATLRAKRDSNDQLPNGDVTPVQPVVDMFSQESAAIGNETVQLDSGDDGYGPVHQMFQLGIAADSALEHVILNRFFKQSDSVSTVRLLQMAQATANGIVVLTRYNYATEGDKNYPSGGSTKLKDADTGIWKTVTNVFNTAYKSNNVLVLMTPGTMTNSTRSFKGAGALIFSPGAYYALIGNGLNGGYGPVLDDTTLASANLTSVSLKVDNQDNFVLDAAPFVSANSVLTAQAPSVTDLSGYVSSVNNSITLNAQKNTEIDMGRQLDNEPSSNKGTQLLSLVNNGGMEKGVKIENGKGGISGFVADPVNAVSGEFYVDAIDLRLPGPMPLEVRRNYSSQNVFDNDFGYGWKLNYMPYLTLSVDSQNILMYAAETDGSVVEYRRQTNGVNGYLNTWAPTPKDNPRLRNGSGSIANLYNSTVTKTTNSLVTYTLRAVDGGVRTYTVRTFSLGGSISRTRPYLDQWQDSRGNYFKFTYGTNSSLPEYGKVVRVESNNGNFLGFDYDIYGHITEAFTGDGRRLVYEYDDFGDLIRVQMPDASEIRYEYNHQALTTNSTRELYSTHLLVREIKPDGRLLLNDYDAQRRVINQYATVGYDLRPIRNASFAYSNNFTFATCLTNIVTGYTLVTDYLTNVTRYEYTNGLITRTVDPLNRTNLQVWYQDNETNAPAYPRSLKQTVDARNLTNDFKYDAQGNATNITVTGDLVGDGVIRSAVSQLTFNTNRLVTLKIDPVGNQTAFTYTNGLSPFLPTSQDTYSSNGTLIASTVFDYSNFTNSAPGGNFIGSYGLLQKRTRAFGTTDGASNEFVYDWHGFVTQSIGYTGTGDPNVANTFFYNLRGELVQQTDAAGRYTVFSYTPRGQIEWKEVYDEQGRRLSGETAYYNLNGEPTWSDGPRFDPEDYVWRDYDGAGRKIEETRWRTRAKSDGTGVEAETGDALFSTTFYEYDPFNNLVKVIDPRGHYTRMRYDSMGQLLERRSYDGTASTNATALSTEGYSYEAGGQLAFATNALGGVTENQYTATGLPKYRKNPDGSTNAWRYYLDGRLQREVQGNGAYWETTFDDANRMVTKTFYSAGGTSMATNVTELDRRGNVFRQVDAVGFAFTNSFDGLDRLKFTAGPVVAPPALGLASPAGTPAPIQQAATNYYDSAGIATTNVNAVGDKTITFTDALGRPTRTEIRDRINTLVREVSTAYAANHHSVTVTNGSNAIITTLYTDNNGQTVLSVGSPATNVKEFVRKSYDASGNLVTESLSSGTNGVNVTWTTAGYGFDGLNRMIAQTNRDTAVTIFAYNPAGNLTNRTVPGGLQWRADYSSAGQMLKSYNLASGGTGTRTNSYSFFGSGSAFAGLLQSHIDGRNVTNTLVYDDWLRPITNAYSGTLAEHSQTTSWQYDVRGMATNVVESFASTNTGPTTGVRRTFNAYNLPDSEQVSVNGVNQSSTSQSWDSAGRRSGLGGRVFSWQADGRLAWVIAGPVYGVYTYSTAGLLASRTVNGLAVNITSRDGVGRILAQNTAVNGTTRLSETLSWTGDGLLATHDLTRSDYTDARSYDYTASSRRLATERLNLTNGVAWTNVFGYDMGSGAGAGVLTRMAEPQSGGAEWTASLDLFNRIDKETNNVIRRAAIGQMNATATYGTVSVQLDGRPLPLNILSTTDTNWPTEWRTVMELKPGTHTLQATAKHSSGMYTTNASSTFTNSAVDQTTLSHFAEGQLSYRVWKNAGGQTNRVQTFTWDGRGRLIATSELDSSNNGYNWTAVYDALGRRLQTSTVIVTNNTPLTNQTKVIYQSYDPSVEFLEVGVTIAGKAVSKIYGPDLDGIYGGLNGTGGLDGTLDGLNIFRPVVADARGNVHGLYDPVTASMVWNQSRPTGYGGVPERRPLALADNGELASSSAWRGRWSDLSGLYWLGARYYDPVAGSFISCDPLGHDSDPSLYAFADGDPINRFDADGRLGKSWIDTASTLRDSDESSIGDRFAAMAFGLGGTILSIPGALDQTFRGASQGMADARAEINTYTGGKAFLARTLELPADFAFGLTKLVNQPIDTISGLPQGLVNFGGKIGNDFYNVGANPSVNSGFNMVEDALGVFGLSTGTARGLTASGVTAPLENFAARSYLQASKGAQWKSYHNSFAPGTARLNVTVGGQTLFRAANSDGAANFGEFASVERPGTPAAAIRGSALDPAITGNRASQLFQVTTRPGFSIQGVAAAQSAGYPGGFTQVFQVSRNSLPTWSSVQRVSYAGGTQ